MTRRRKPITRPAALAILTGLLVLVPLAVPPAAVAHGTMQDPSSRLYHCRFHDNPENPQHPACRAAISLGGTQPVYDWNEVNIPNANGRHRELIPDGRLCGAGRDKYRGFDLARSDWPATTLTAGASREFRYRATAPHRGHFELYVTRSGYSPTQPLRWADLQFMHVASDPPLSGGAYVFTARLPSGHSGRHLIYTIWQRSDSPEAFYACSDVIFG